MKASSPCTAVTYFRLFRSTRLIVMTLLAILLACFCSAFSACAAFFCASLAARFCASTDSEAVAASRASVFVIASVAVSQPYCSTVHVCSVWAGGCYRIGGASVEIWVGWQGVVYK